MAYKSICTDATAMNSTETTETLIGTIQVPQGVKKIIGVGANILTGTAGETTLENVAGKITLRSNDMSPWAGDQEFLTPVFSIVSSGGLAANPYIHPTNIDVSPGGNVKVYGVMDLALTINNKVRAQLVFE